MSEPAWNGRDGTAGGAAFGAALTALREERDISPERLGQALKMSAAEFTEVLTGARRIGISALARLAAELRTRPIDSYSGSAASRSRSMPLASIRCTFYPKDRCATMPASICARSTRVTAFPKRT